jgi:hypothetical protein
MFAICTTSYPEMQIANQPACIKRHGACQRSTEIPLPGKIKSMPLTIMSLYH